MVNLLGSALSGALLSGAFAPIGKWWLAPIALALHMYTLRRSSHPFQSSFIFALVFNAITLHWTSIYVGSVPWIILFLGQSILFLPLGFAKRYGIAFYPLIFLIMEEVRARYPFEGFGWLRIAFSQADAPYRSIAAIAGASGLTAIVLSLALALLHIKNLRLIWLPLLPLLLIFVPLNIQSLGSVKVLMVQGNVPSLGLDFNSRATQVFYNHVKETKKALEKNPDVDFILWPENAVDVDPFTNSKIADALNGFDKPLVVGAVVRQLGEIHNVSILWTKQAQSVYVKQHLTPFGEYIPLRSIAEKISPFVENVSDFSPGKDSKIFSINNARIAPVICYELIDDRLLEVAAKTSNLIVVQTNNATFGKSAQSIQQLSITRIRAIEHARNTLSVSTTGVSAVIDYQGDIIQQTEMHKAAHIFATPELIDTQTPRDKAGDWALVGVLIWLLLLGGRGRRAYT